MTTKPLHRLHVRELTSIGIVAEGDDPEAHITFWKKAPTLTKAGAENLLRQLRIKEQKLNPSMTRAEVEAEIFRKRPDIAAVLAKSGPGSRGMSMGSPTDRARVAVKAAWSKLDEHQRAIDKIRNDYQEIGNGISEVRNMTLRKEETVGTVRGQVDAIALEMVEKGEARDLTEARPMVWRQRPDLVAKSRQEAPESVASTPGKTITDRIREVVDEATRRAAWQPLLQGWGDGQTRDQIISKVRLEVWRSPDGSELRDLERAYGAKKYTPAASVEIRKSRGGDRYSRALNLLDSGIWEQ